MKKKNIVYIGAVVIVIIAVSAIAVTMNNNTTHISTGDDIYSSDPYGSAKIPYDLFEPNYSNDTATEFAINPTWNPLTEDYRPRWEGCSDEEYIKIFDDLPKMPQDFYKKYQMFMKGTLTDYDRLGEEYWKQPEFFDLEQNFFNRYVHRNPTMWIIGQLSCKPSYRYVELKPGATVQISTFFHTEVIGSEAYLGAIFYTHFPDNAMKQTGEVIFDQPDNAESFIEAKIISPDNNEIFEDPLFQQQLIGKYVNVENDEKIILFPASYRKINYQNEKIQMGFQEDWCHKIVAEIHIKDNCPPGNYIVAVDFKNPSTSINEEFNWVISGSPYYSFYYTAFREYYPISPYFQILVTVV